MEKYLVSRRTLLHAQGTKEYHLLSVVNNKTGRALVVFRWGKKGSWGQMQVQTGTISAIRKLYQEKTHEKEKGRYNQTNDTAIKAETDADVKRLVTPPYWAKLGSDNIKYVMPDADVTGIEEPQVVEFDEELDGKFKVKHRIKEHPDFVEDEAVKAQRQLEEAKNRQKADPLWGMF